MESAYALCLSWCHKGKKIGHCLRRLPSEGSRSPNIQRGPTSLGSLLSSGGLGEWLEEKASRPSMTLRLPTIHYWFFRQVMMKLQQEAQGQSKEIAGLWPKQLRITSTISALPVVGNYEERHRKAPQINTGIWVCYHITSRILGFLIIITLHDLVCWWQMRYTCLKGGKLSSFRSQEGSWKEI